MDGDLKNRPTYTVKAIRSNGGYYSYVAKFMGKDLGMFTASVYFFYSILAIPSVVLFLLKIDPGSVMT